MRVPIALFFLTMASGEKYDEAIDGIVYHAKLAARAYNAGDVDEAEDQKKRAEEAFATAIRIDDREPQAYLSMATFRLNTHDFDAAEELWGQVAERAWPSDALVQFAIERQHFARVGRVSMNRDKAYKEKDMRAALKWTLEQQELMPRSPRVLHDLATIYATMDDERCEDAYRASQRFAVDAAARYFGLGAKWRLASLPHDETIRNAYLAGDDGVVFTIHDGFLTVYADDTPWVPLHGNFWLAQEIWRPPGAPETPYDHSGERKWLPPPRGLPVVERKFDRAATALTFAGTNYYHFVAEVLPRVVLLRQETPILVPKVAPRLFELLRLATDAELVTVDNGPPGPRIFVTELKLVAFERVGTHALTPAPMLRRTRDHVLKQVERHEREDRLVLYVSRRTARTRRFANDTDLVNLLREHQYKVIDFDGMDDMTTTIQLFQRAAIVIGVHGAGLVNTLFCHAGTTVVELGFPHTATRHYEHMAKSLDLRYHRILLDRSNASFASDTVTLSNLATILQVLTQPRDEL